jgi:hypothetical protein
MEFSKREMSMLKQLDTPEKIQDFLDRLPTNRELDGDTVLSPLRVLHENKAHCIEAAMLAALILELHGEKPLILDLVANRRDQDHVICLFKRNGCWGAIAKTNHYCLGYRDPVYRTIREMVMSYFHEYLNKSGEKTLRSYSLPINMRIFDKHDWRVAQDDIWVVPEHLLTVRHFKIMKKGTRVRVADDFTRDLNNIERQPLN